MYSQTTPRDGTPCRMLIRLCITAIAIIAAGQSLAAPLPQSCYDRSGMKPPTNTPGKTLHVLIDQTMALTQSMKTSLLDLVGQWGDHGERVTISRFSANIKGQYAEMVYDAVGDAPPGEEYLFHLRRKEKHALLDCLAQRQTVLHEQLLAELTSTLNRNSDKLPKSNILHSLRDFAVQVVQFDKATDKTILLVSDGLENSDVFSFHQRNKIRLINPEKMMSMVRGRGLIANWEGARVYLFGLGYISNEKFYARPNIIKPLKKFWMKYFAESNAVLQDNSIGTPMLLTKSIM